MESAVVDGIIVDSPVSDHEAPARPRKRKRSAPAQASSKQRGPIVVVAVCANPNVWGGRVSLWSSLNRATVDDARILVDLPPVNWIDANAPGEHRGAYPREVDGYHLREDEYHGRHGHDHRLQLTCPYHGNCQKSRNTGAAQTAHYGCQEPLAFLAVWAAKGQFAATKVDHHTMHPSLAEQKAWLVEHFPAEFQLHE